MIFNIIIFIAGFLLGCIAYSDGLAADMRNCKNEQELIEVLVKRKILKSKHNTK